MWDKITLGFDVEEETVNFGCRKMAICDSAVYETNTLAIFSNENEDEEIQCDKTPRVTCMSYTGSDSGIIVTIDESLITFDSTGAEMKNRCTFNATIDCFAVSAVGSLLFVVLSNGDVHCLLLNSNRNHIFLKNLGPPTNENEKRFVNIFIREKENICDLILVAYDGCVHKLRDINISELVQVCISQAADSIVKLTDSLIVDQIYLTNAPDENLKVALAYEYYKFGEHFLLMIMEGNGRQELQIWSNENELLDFLALPSELNLKKVHITKNGNLIYGLTSSGTLLVICSYTFTPILHLEDLDIVDFEILSEEEESLLVLTKKPSQQLQLLSIPGFKPKFSLDVNKSSFLARNQTSLDDLLYLEGQTKKDDGPVVSLHLKIITESQPEYRLERILRRGKFEEAEQFAKSFNLDIELVYKAHLRALSSDIQPWSNCQVPLEESGCKLKNLLSQVKDIEFVAQCAINAISSDFTLMKDILTYAENRIRAHPDVNPILQDYYNRIRNSLLRLSTFVAISEKPLTVEKWLLFCKVNLIEECQSLLKQGFLDQVILIWSRHIHQIKDQLSYDDALNFLKSFPPFAPIKNLLRWLRIFLPDCFVLFPNMLRNVVIWCKEKVNMMELQELSEWPQSGVWFLKKLLKIIRRNVQPCKISSENIIQSEYAGESPIKDVLYYIKILNEITMVKEKHGILISIAEYTQDNDKEVMFTILDKMPLEELRSFVNGFFKELILERNLHSDGIISENIRLLVEGSTDWWYWDEAPWEGRVAVLIDCITGIEEKLKCVLSVLKHSPVPWSVTVMNICEDALKHKNPLTKLISEQRKLVDCKLIMKKYNLKDNILTKSHVNRIILYIFAQNQLTMLEDSLQIANTFDFEMSTEVYKLYAQHLIEKGEFNAVLSFLDDDNLPLKVVLKCCEHIIVRTHCLSSRKCLRAVYDNYIEVLDSVNSKLLRAICKLQKDGELITSVVSSGICKQLKCDYYLKTEFNIDAASEHFKPGEYDKMLNHCLMSILKNMLRDPKSMEKESMKLSMLSTCFEFNKEEIYIKFIDLAISQSEITVAVYASRLLMKESVFSPQVAKQLINLGSLILRHCIKMRRDSTVTSIDSNITFVLYELVVAGMNTCAPDCLEKGLEISNWCKLTKCSPQLDCASELSAGKIQPSYTQSMNFTTWLSLLATYGQFLDENNMKSSIIFVNDPNLNDTSEPQGMYELVNCLQNLVKNEQEQISFQAVTTTHWSLLRQCFAFNHPIAEVSLVAQTKTVSTQFISKLLKKLIGSRHLDCHYGLALLHYFPLEEATNWIMESTKRFRHDFQRLYSITELGMVYFHKNKCAQQWSTIYKLRKQCVWGKQIMEYGLSYKEAFRDTQQDQCQLLLKLMAVPSMNVDVLAKYCKDVNFDFQSCLKVYLKQILLSWEPEFEVKADAVTGDKALVVKPTHVKLLQKCHDICGLIENVAEINQSIATIMGSVNNYYYEVFLILITLLEEKGVKADTTLFSLHRAVLLFLSSYQRISKPQEYEKENWYQLYPNEQSLPSISEYRLPFRLIYPRLYKGEPWKIIQHELNINTYTKWFAVLDALELDKNVLCSLAINQITTDGVIDQEINNEWCTYLRNQKLLADVKACVENITNLEMSCASLYYVVNHLPPGADQLAAAKLCFMYAKRWRETEKSDKAESGFQKVQKKYLTISTTHILYIHNLGKPHYLQLVLKPSELIIALYGDPIILQKNTGNEIVFPDINKATEEISTLHKIDVMKLRMELLEEWLQPENFIANVSCDETIIRQHNSDGITETKFSDVEYQNFQRACYVVERDIMTFGKNLTIIVFDHNSDDSKPISVRLRALQCLYAVCTKDKMEQITEKSLDELWNLLNTLKFVMELEALGLTYSVPMFESCDKSEIVRSLLTLKNPKAVRLAAYMSRYFKINHSTIWNSLLNHMCSYEMIIELSEVLPDLSRNYHTLDLVVFEKAWSTVLKLPIEKAPQFPSEEDTEIIERSVELLYFCPIIDQIDLNYIKQLYLKINRSDLADSICNMNI